VLDFAVYPDIASYCSRKEMGKSIRNVNEEEDDDEDLPRVFKLINDGSKILV
jgi:hypothetical protein